METDDLRRDDLVGRLISKTSPESPSAGFSGQVMESIQRTPALAHDRRPFFYFIKNSWPWVLLAVFVVAVLYFSNIPLKDFLPGKDALGTSLIPYYESLLKGLKAMFTGNKAVSFTLLLVFTGGVLYGLDLLLNRRLSGRHHIL